MKNQLLNRIEKAKKRPDGKKIVSKGVLSKVKEANRTKGKPNPKNKHKVLRKSLEDQGFEKVKIINKNVVSAIYEGENLNEDKALNIMRELGLVK